MNKNFPPPAPAAAGINLPNLLTLGRVLAIPLLVAVFYMPFDQITQNRMATWPGVWVC